MCRRIYKGRSKRNEPELECANRWHYRCVCNKEWFRQERVSFLLAARGSRMQVTWLKASRSMRKSSNAATLHTVQISVPAITPFLVPYKRLWGANDSPRTTTSSSKCGTGSQRSLGNFTRQPFTALCRSETSSSTGKANTSDKEVLVSVPRPPFRFFLNAPHR